MVRIIAALSAGVLLLSGGFTTGFAGQSGPDQSLRNTAEQIISLIDRAALAEAGVLKAPDKVALQELTGELQAGHLLMTELMRQRGIVLQGTDGIYRERHHLAVERYQTVMSRLLELLPQIAGEFAPSPSDLAELRSALLQLAPPRSRPVHGLLPYSHPVLSAQPPVTTPRITPAYRLLSIPPATAADLAAAPEAPISPLIVTQVKAIAAQVGRAHWDPGAIYDWVRANIRTEWYWGSMKGAEETLRQGGGNDADQAALLVAMLRASGYPARYVRGVMEFFPDLGAATAMTGIADPVQLLSFFQAAGIPCEPVYQGGEIGNIRIEHLWVETLVPYANYRGIVADDAGKVWVPLDASVKTGAAEEDGAVDLLTLANTPLAAFRDRYLDFPREQTPLELLAGEVGEFLSANFPGTAFEDVLHVHRQPQLPLGILPGTLPFVEVAVTAEYAVLPPELLHQVRIGTGSGEQILFDVTLPLHQLSNRKVTIGFAPESVADQELVNLWGGLDNTPPYLVRLRPALLVDDETVAVGREGFVPGETFLLTTEFLSPSGRIAINDEVVSGYPLALGIVAGKALPPPLETLEMRAPDWMHRSALAYTEEWDKDEGLLADLLDTALARPFPSWVRVGGMLRSEALAGVIMSNEWEGLFIDAGLRRVAAVSRRTGGEERVKSFMALSGLAGSVHEHRLFDREFGVAGVSTAMILAITRQQGLPLLTLDAANAGAVLPELTLEPAVLADITAALDAGLRVHLPAAPVTVQEWQGVGYFKENPATGEGGYMLSGGLAGGQTVLGRRDWPAEVAAVMAEPFSGPPNEDPAQAFALVSVTPPEIRLATAGEELAAPVMTLVRDPSGVPVAGALVTYTVRSGGGWLIDDQQTPAAAVSTLTVMTGRDGIARARFVPGEQTSANPVVFVREGDRQANLVGENLLDARLLSGSQAGLTTPIAIFGFAGLPDPSQSPAYGHNLHGEVFSYSGDLLLLLKDRFGNPVANHPVDFRAGTVQAAANSLCRNPPGLAPDQYDARLFGDDPCRERAPVLGECAAAEQVRVFSRSDGGAISGVVLGGLPFAAYPVTAAFTGTAGNSTVSWTHYSNTVASCSAIAPPENRLTINYQQRLDTAGRNVDARPAQQPALIQAKSYLLAEETNVAPGGQHLSCTPLPSVTCSMVAGTGAFTLRAPDLVMLDGRPATPAAVMTGSRELPWLYQGTVTLPLGLNEIPLEATATRTMPQIVNSCSGCGTLEPAAAVAVGPVRRSVPVWGAAVTVPNAATALVNSQGVAQRDLRFDFAIQPPGYAANQTQVLLYCNGELWDTLPAGVSGNTAVTFPAGYWFDPKANYELQVLLNNAGEVNAIRSTKIPLLQRTAAVDLRIDGLPDALEDQIGAFVLLNNDFDEQDTDPAIILPDAATATMVTGDDELKRSWLQIDDSSGSAGSWRVTASDPTRLRIYHQKNGHWVEFKPTDPPEPVGAFPAIIPLYLEGLAESAGIQADNLVASFLPAGGGAVADTVPLTVLDMDLAVDGNRDRTIDFQHRADEQALFWVNNDRDYLHSEDGLPVEDDAREGDDSIDAAISCKRDLEDFARLHLRLGAVARPGPLSYSVQIVPDDGMVQPMLNLFPAINLSDGYLGLPGSDATADQQIIVKLMAAVGKLPTTLPADKIEADKTNYFLFEGRMPGKGQLVLTASHQGMPVATRSVRLELVDPSWFYDHFVLSQAGEDDDSPVKPLVNPEGMAPDASRLGHYQPESSDYLLFVHGWNMQGWEKRRWAETVFKRLWWQGYKGKVGLFDWPCRTLPSWDFLINYDRSEFIAWQSATALKGVLEKLQGDHAGRIRLLAHSQGNVVAGEALRLGDPGLVHTYVASQAALSGGLHESSLPQIRDFEPKTPDVMSSYPADTNREPYLSQLTGKVGSIFNYYNARDYALTGDSLSQPTWLLNNATRPDGSLGYGYQGEMTNYPPTAPSLGFYRNINADDLGEDPVMNQLSIPEDSYEIFSFCAQSRNHALGASEVTLGGVATALSLEGFGFNNEKSSHSRQFRSNVVTEQPYWQRFVADTEISVKQEGM